MSAEPMPHPCASGSVFRLSMAGVDVRRAATRGRTETRLTMPAHPVKSGLPGGPHTAAREIVAPHLGGQVPPHALVATP